MRRYFYNKANGSVRIVNPNWPNTYCVYMNIGEKKVKRSRANTNGRVLFDHRFHLGKCNQLLHEICVNQFRKYFKFGIIPTIWWGE
jgi:hypothetical protein